MTERCEAKKVQWTFLVKGTEAPAEACNKPMNNTFFI